MRMNDIMAKLRKKNKEHYYILLFSLILSTILVASYAVMYYSPTVQNILPAGGDSRKQANMIFAVAVLGCAVFTTYASSLFFKYKSGEFGVFLALGAKKRDLRKALYKEIGLMAVFSSIVGLVLSLPVAWGIWKLFQIFIVDTKEMAFTIGWLGLTPGVIFCLFVTACIFWLARRFIKRSNLIALIREEQTAETVKTVKPWLGPVGLILIALGLFLGYCLPMLTVQIWGQYMPSLWNVTYLVSFVGIYMFMLHIVVGKKKGKRPEKYYKNIISVNMMRFTGRQTVRNMCVITLLIAGALFATFYVPTTATSLFLSVKNNPVDNVFFYRATENQISKDEIYDMAATYGTEITSYTEMTALSLLEDGTVSDIKDKKLVSNHVDVRGYATFFSESEFNAVSGQNVDVADGTYKVICYPEQEEGIWDDFDGLSKITNPINNTTQEVQYSGRVDYQPLSDDYGVNYIISDADYAQYNQTLPDQRRFHYVLFNVKNPSEQYEFASALKDEIILRFSPDAAVGLGYDEYEIEQAAAAGEPIDPADYTLDLSPDNNQLFYDWDYYPSFTVLAKQDMVKNMAVFLMLFIYIAIICFTAVAIIAYTRSVTVGLNNKRLFSDLRHLGANEAYITRVIKKQLSKIFIYPTVTGSAVMYFFYCLIMYNNDNGFSASELIGLGIDLGIFVIIAAFMYLVYRISLRKVLNMVAKQQKP